MCYLLLNVFFIYIHVSPMIMCSAEVTGSLTPTVAKHTQSVEPEERTHRLISVSYQMQLYSHGESLSIFSIPCLLPPQNVHFLCGRTSEINQMHLILYQWCLSPAGMMPMWRSHDCREGSCSDSPASCCVRPITPCSSSLNIPSPPTHTTLRKGQT
jgi:hypothetical protein